MPFFAERQLIPVSLVIILFEVIGPVASSPGLSLLTWIEDS